MPKYKKPPHDALVKHCFDNLSTAREFLEEYLPSDLSQRLDFKTIKRRKDSFVETSLKKKISDVVFSLDLNHEPNASKEGFVYILIEHQSSSDYWISFRLWKYTLLLLDKYTKDKNKLPLIFPMVFYNGKSRNNSPRNLAELFQDPELARKYLYNDYHLVDLQKMSDDDINYQKHLSMLLYVMKHIHDRDMIKMIEEMFAKCEKAILIDKKNEYIHLRSVLWYAHPRIEDNKLNKIAEVISNNLHEEEGESNMRSIADKFYEEGYIKGRSIADKFYEEGYSKGKLVAEGLVKETEIKIIQSMLAKGLSISQIAELTDIKEETISIFSEIDC